MPLRCRRGGGLRLCSFLIVSSVAVSIANVVGLRHRYTIYWSTGVVHCAVRERLCLSHARTAVFKPAVGVLSVLKFGPGLHRLNLPSWILERYTNTVEVIAFHGYLVSRSSRKIATNSVVNCQNHDTAGPF